MNQNPAKTTQTSLEARQTRLGVIFDLDGTLVDTLDDITSSLNAAFASLGLPPRPRERVRALIGEGLRNLLRRASGIEDHDVIAALVSRYREVYPGRLLENTRLYPGIDRMLDALVEIRIPFCVLSNKPDEFTFPICRALLSPWPFLQCVGSVEELLRKPHPGVALSLADRMNCSPANVLFVGDSSTDVETARNAGMASAAVSWGYRDRPKLENAVPDFLIDRPMDLVEAIKSRWR